MKKILIIISFAMSLISCGESHYETIVVLGKDAQSHTTVIQGMGVMLADDYVLTSAHVVRDDRLSYEIDGTPYIVQKRDTEGDRAILQKRGNIEDVNRDIEPRGNTQKGDLIYTQVSRAGNIVTLTGKVLDPSGSVTAYDTSGRVVTLSGIVLTDLNLVPGDSGAPIFNAQGELADVVHVR